MTNVDTATDGEPLAEGQVKAFYPDDRANKPISIRQAAADYKSWREAHYKMHIIWR